MGVRSLISFVFLIIHRHGSKGQDPAAWGTSPWSAVLQAPLNLLIPSDTVANRNKLE